MRKELDITLTPREAADEAVYRRLVAQLLKIKEPAISWLRILRRSIDARTPDVKVKLRLLVGYNEPAPSEKEFFPQLRYPKVSGEREVLIAGAGPAGLFAALRLIELGLKPVIFERGKSVEERRKDVALLQEDSILNPDSNYCFGEGGAGTFSDGKLYTRAKKRGSVRKIYDVLHFHGAAENILYDSHPHIGTDKLPGIITNMRSSILDAGGEIHFNTKITGLIIENKAIRGVKCGDEAFSTDAFILATGHSARDTYQMLQQNNIRLESKGFAMGVRVEHPQDLINSIQYHSKRPSSYLPAASYRLSAQVEGRGVYSFCMCPGGYVVPSATADKQMVVNGMSPSLRNSPFANSGIVVEVRPEDYQDFAAFGALAGLKYQEHLEQLAFTNGGNGQVAPAQLLNDFVKGKLSGSLLTDCSYEPGVISSPLHFWLPQTIAKPLQAAFHVFGKTMKGYLTNHAVVLGVESRTSSPVKIPRDTDTLQHVEIAGLYPCGEGAGYAGGIASAAMDGERCANKIAENFATA